VRAGVVPRDVGRAAVKAAKRWRADPASAAGGNPAVGEELQPGARVELKGNRKQMFPGL